MTEWRLADFLVEVPAPLQQFLAAQPQWADQVSLMGPTPAVTPAAYEAYLHWLLATGRVSYRAMLRWYQRLLTAQDTRTTHSHGQKESF